MRYVSVLKLQVAIAKKWDMPEWAARKFIRELHPLGVDANIVPSNLVRMILREAGFTKEQIDSYVENNCEGK